LKKFYNPFRFVCFFNRLRSDPDSRGTHPRLKSTATTGVHDSRSLGMVFGRMRRTIDQDVASGYTLPLAKHGKPQVITPRLSSIFELYSGPHCPARDWRPSFMRIGASRLRRGTETRTVCAQALKVTLEDALVWRLHQQSGNRRKIIAKMTDGRNSNQVKK
jgi:hypothetical protein